MPEKRAILVIEDDHAISNFICRALTANDYKAIPAASGKEGLSLFFSHSPALVLLDLGLPDMDGLEVLEQFSDLPQEVPTIIISARDRESEKVKALDMGADDYVSKPFNPQELAARVRSHLRRYTLLGDVNAASRTQDICTGRLCYSPEEMVLRADGESVRLTATELKIVDLLMRNLGRVFPAEEIYRRVWNEEAYATENTVMVHIRRIREKIELNPKEPEYLKVVWGIGYKMEKIAVRR